MTKIVVVLGLIISTSVMADFANDVIDGSVASSNKSQLAKNDSEPRAGFVEREIARRHRKLRACRRRHRHFHRR